MKRFLCVLLLLALTVSLFGVVLPVSASDISFDGLLDVWDPDTSSNYSKPNSQATSLTLSIADGEGWNGSKALAFSVSDNKDDWANYAQIVPAVSDWFGADYLYFYVKNYTGNINISLVSEGTEYKLKNGVSDAAGKWNGGSWDTVKTGSSWFFFQVGTNYTGWLRVKLTAFAAGDGSGNSTEDMSASALTSIDKVMFSVSGLSADQYPMTVYFDRFMVSGASFAPENAPANLHGVWNLNDLTEGTEYVDAAFSAQASLKPVSYGDGLALQWSCLGTEQIPAQAIPLKTANFTNAGELWFWLDLTDMSAEACGVGVGIGDADGVSYVPGLENYDYSSVRFWYYSSSAMRVGSALSSEGWIDSLPKNYSGWVGISLSDYAALMAGRKFDCTRVNTLYLGLGRNEDSKTAGFTVDNFCINTEPNGLHVVDATKAVPQKVTVSMPADPTAERNFTWHTNGWSETDLQVVAAKSAETADFTSDAVLKFKGVIPDMLYNAYVHNAKATGLTPGTAYCYRVGDASLDVWSDTGCFVTDDGDSDFSFIYVTDMQTGTSGPKNSLYTLQKSMETAPDAEFFMNLGDIVNNSGNNSEFLSVLGKDGFFAFGRLTTAAVSGNHEAYFNVDDVIRNQFYFDQPETSTDAKGIYYSFNYGNVHFVGLNTNTCGYTTLDDVQLAWLKEDLASEAAQNADFRIVMMHRAPYSTGAHYYYHQDHASLTKQLTPVFAQYNVDLVFQGHDHVYALTKQIGADGIASDSETSSVWSEGAGGYIDAMYNNSDPVYFIGGTAGTRYEPVPVWDEAQNKWIIPATSYYEAGHYAINVSQTAMTEYLAKFQCSDVPANAANRTQSLFSVVRVTDGQLVVDTYAVDSQVMGDCTYYNSFALDKKEPVHEHTFIPGEIVTPSCTEEGYTLQVCSCGESRKVNVVPALGHKFVDGSCTRCGAEDPNWEPPVPVDPCEGYTDINRSKWYHTAADFVISRGLMGSTKTNELTFEPNTKVSRAMVASILYRMAGSPAVEYRGTFTDVKNDKWFTTAIEWCAQNGLASGKGDGKFDPNGNVTRQELAVFMMKMVEYLGKDTSGRNDLSCFADGNKVPSWAKTYVQWAVDAGLISGQASGGKTYLAPKDNATRAEFASIIMRFVQNIVEAG